MEKDYRYLAQSATRMLDVLEECVRSGPEVRIKNLSARLNMGKSTVHRFLSTLEVRGYIEQTQARGEYRLTPKLYQLGTRSMGGLDLLAQSNEVCRQLSNVSGETVHLVVLKGDKAVFVNKVSSPMSFLTYSDIGKTAPAYCIASGKALLAHLPASEIQRLFSSLELKAFTENTITDKNRLKEEFQLIRSSGYAAESEEYERGVCCVAAPIRRFDGQVVAAVSVSMLKVNTNPEKWRQTTGLVREAAGDISRNLGYREECT